MGRKVSRKEGQPTLVSVVQEFFMLGMGLPFISKAMSLSMSNVKSYTNSIKNSSERPLRPEERFQRILTRYAGLVITQPINTIENLLKTVCEEWLQISSLKNRICGLEETIDRVTISFYPADVIPYINLFWVILRGKREDFNSRWTDFLLKYSLQLVQNETIIPTRRKIWEDEIYNRYLEDQWYRSIHLPYKEVKRRIKEAMAELDNPHKEVIYYRFGLRTTKITLAQAGEKMNLSKQGVSQKEKEALGFLTHSSVVCRLKELTDFFPWTLEEYSNNIRDKEKYIAYLGKSLRTLTEENKRLRLQLKKEKDKVISNREILIKLVRPISDVRFPKRAERFFKDRKIHFLGELVQRTNQEILEARSLGTKSLKEIRDILQDLGLDTGMCLSPELKEELENLIHPKRKQG